jgi:hypothetical protein
MQNIRLIACDLDGTLLLNGAQQLRPETCGLIRRLMDEKGLLFCAASGRQYANLQRLFAPIKDRIVYVCENGCISYVRGKRIHKELMQRDLGQDLLKAVMMTDGAEALLSGEKTHYIQPKNMAYYYHMCDVVRNDVTLVPDILDTPEEYMKVSLYEKGGLHDVDWWTERFSSRCTVVTGQGEWLDMMPLGVNKGTGLKKLLDFLNIRPEEVMAIGDNDNDLEMLEMAGLPAAVQTAKPAVLGMAKITTDTVEHLFEKILADDRFLISAGK